MAYNYNVVDSLPQAYLWHLLESQFYKLFINGMRLTNMPIGGDIKAKCYLTECKS